MSNHNIGPSLWASSNNSYEILKSLLPEELYPIAVIVKTTLLCYLQDTIDDQYHGLESRPSFVKL